MRPMFQGDSCAINEAGISTAGNPLSRAFDAATGDPLHARQIREGFMGGRPMGPMMGPGGGQMMRPMMPGDGMDGAWQEIAGPRPMGPMLGEAMPEQLARHMSAPYGPASSSAGPSIFAEGPQMGMPMGAEWATEFGGRPMMPGPMQGIRPGMMRPQGPDWSAEFARQAQAGGNMQDMDMAFRQAQGNMGPEMQVPGGMPFQPMMGPMMGPGMMGRPMAGHSAMGSGATDAYLQSASASSQMKTEEKSAPAVDEQADLAQAAQMVEMLRNSGNPKFASSRFVNFIDKVSKGDLKFHDNTVVDRAGNHVDWDALYDTEAATATDAERAELEGLWKDTGANRAGLEAAFKAAGGDVGEMEEIWKQSMGGMGEMWDQAAMADAWKMAGLEEEAEMMNQAWMGDDYNMEELWKGKKDEYKFQDDNPFLDEADPLAKALRLIAEGKDREAMLCLEAEVTKNPESSEGWRMLGQLYAEMDQDVEAIQCLRKGHEVDPYNLDSLLALGVSCTNELDQLPALRYLREWISNHDDHQVLVRGLDPPAEYEYEAWRQQVTSLFNQAANASPLDADVFVALGVMENINRNYEGAIKALATACRLRPHDHTCWNKLGATLANSGKSEQAVSAYHCGLQLKPNYARSWSNLAIAHANLQQHKDAARFYLSSLVLNPEATHIWSFLHSAVLNMGNVDAFKAIDEKDINAMKGLVDGVLDPSALPMPKKDLDEPPDDILRSMGL